MCQKITILRTGDFEVEGFNCVNKLNIQLYIRSLISPSCNAKRTQTRAKVNEIIRETDPEFSNKIYLPFGLIVDNYTH